MRKKRVLNYFRQFKKRLATVETKLGIEEYKEVEETSEPSER